MIGYEFRSWDTDEHRIEYSLAFDGRIHYLEGGY